MSLNGKVLLDDVVALQVVIVVYTVGIMEDD